jgi:hypothetical protein
VTTIAFATLFLGLVLGPQQIELAVENSPAAVQLVLGPQPKDEISEDRLPVTLASPWVCRSLACNRERESAKVPWAPWETLLAASPYLPYTFAHGGSHVVEKSSGKAT